MNKKAFTLIELLVTIVIIGIIAALLLPALGRVRGGIRRAHCVNNLRQIGVAWYLYLDDHDNCFPVYDDGSELVPRIGDTYCNESTFGGKVAGFTQRANTRPLNKYLNVVTELGDEAASEIFHCPSDKPGVFFSDGYIPLYKLQMSTFDIYGNSYLANRNILYYEVGNKPVPRPLSTVATPYSETWLVRDFNLYSHGDHRAKVHSWNILYLDSHVGFSLP